MHGQVTNRAGYLGVVQTLAHQALAIARDAAPHRPREGERRWPMASALPAARILLGEPADDDVQALSPSADGLAQTLADPAGKVTDGFGHHRPIYPWLALHLLGSAAKLIDSPAVIDRVTQGVHTLRKNAIASPDNDPRLSVWQRLIARQHGLVETEAQTLPPPTEESQPLVPLGLDDLLDTWTYRELVGLHGLHLCAVLTGDSAAALHVHSAAAYHLGHTQPDYTTYQPWALAAFASDPQTAGFAEQQLHDVTSHLSIEGSGGAVLPALLLADAAATMGGRAAQAWSDG